MHLRPLLIIPALCSSIVMADHPVLATEAAAQDTVKSAMQVFKTVMTNDKTRLPENVLSKAQAIAIIPNVLKAGFVVGGSHGRGILVLRNANGSWNNPVFLNLSSGSLGFQAGAQSSDVILVFRTQDSVETVLTKDVTIGGSISVAAGPVGGNVVSPNDGQTETDIFSYALNEGLFAGVSLEGAKISVDRRRNADFYGQRNITVQQILTNPNLKSPAMVGDLHQLLSKPPAKVEPPPVP
jgi:SH3 domain-containing YSC84-like protein 1